MSGKVINLRQWRKSRERAGKAAEADRNAAVHGLSKDVTDLARARADKAARDHAAHKIDEREDE